MSSGYVGRRNEIVRRDIRWDHQAACRDLPPSLFCGYEGETHVLIVRREHKAKKICAVCPVRDECLEEALRGAEDFGVWGGMNEAERKSEKRRRQRLALQARLRGA